MKDIVLSSDLSLWGLAFSAFLSSTLLPGGSEAVLLLLATQGELDWKSLLIVASVANTLGGIVTYMMGLWAERGLVKTGRFKPPSNKSLVWLQKFGSPVLLFSWLPVVGDGLCLGAGWLQMHWFRVTVAMFVGKTVRYASILYVALN